MRLTIIKDSQLKWRGLALVWNGPLNLNAYDVRGKLLAVLLDYADSSKAGQSMPAVWEIPRELLPVCEECRINKAELWCKDHGHYVCVDCVALKSLHTICRLVSLAVKRAERIETGASLCHTSL